MDDHKLEERKQKFQKCNFSILQRREQFNLSLRKKKIDDFISSKRFKSMVFSQDSLNLEINPKMLDIEDKYKDMLIDNLEKDTDMLYNMITSNNKEYVKLAVYMLRVYGSENETDVSRGLREFSHLENCGLLKHLLHLLKTTEDPQLILEIYWVLINFTSHKDEKNEKIFNIFHDESLVPTFVKHMSSEYIDIVDHCIWLMTHIVSENSDIRDLILNSQVYFDCIKFLKQNQINFELLRSIIWFLCNACKTTDTCPSESILKEILCYFSSYLYTKELQIVVNCIWGLYYLTQYDSFFPEIYQHIINSGALVKILKFDYTKMQPCVLPALRLIGNLLGGKFDIVDQLLDLDVLNFLHKILSNFPESAKKEVAWALANLAAGSYHQVEAILESSVLECVLDLLSDLDIQVRREALWIFSNITSNTVIDQCEKLVRLGILEKLVKELEKTSQERLLLLCLQILSNTFHAGSYLTNLNGHTEPQNPFVKKFECLGGAEILEKLQNHSSFEIFTYTTNVLTKYFKTENLIN